MLFLSSAQSHILRLSCKSIAEFEIEKKGYCLKENVIDTINKVSLQQCFDRCLHNLRCKSINMERNGFGICQLNARSSHDSIDNVTLTVNNRWNFYSTNFSSRLVSSSSLVSCFVLSSEFYIKTNIERLVRRAVLLAVKH